jgi:HTH-type transcriptional regulator, competence development regulator
MNATDFGAYLKQLRESKGFSTHKLAELSGVSQSYISHVESGRKEAPSPYVIRNLSAALEVMHIDMMIKAGHIKESEVMEWLGQSGSKN